MLHPLGESYDAADWMIGRIEAGKLPEQMALQNPTLQEVETYYRGLVRLRSQEFNLHISPVDYDKRLKEEMRAFKLKAEHELPTNNHKNSLTKLTELLWRCTESELVTVGEFRRLRKMWGHARDIVLMRRNHLCKAVGFPLGTKGQESLRRKAQVVSWKQCGRPSGLRSQDCS